MKDNILSYVLQVILIICLINLANTLELAVQHIPEVIKVWKQSNEAVQELSKAAREWRLFQAEQERRRR